MARIKEPVRLRRKKLADGSESLYLDIYSEGVRRYEFLRLYVVPETDRNSRLRNAETLRIAETIKSERIVQIQKGRYDFSDAPDTGFWDVYWELAEKRRSERLHKRGRDEWDASARYIKEYDGRDLRLKDVSRRWVDGFVDYLRTARCTHRDKPLSQNTQSLIYDRLRAVLNEACRRGLIGSSPAAGARAIPHKGVERAYLTVEELHAMARTETPHAGLKRAFLFSCLTGLRKSDIQTLTWGDVTEMDGFTRLTFRQYKTDAQMYLDIAEQAAKLMGKRGGRNDLVFADFHYSHYTTVRLREWAHDAGVEKDLTFHSGRHTFAVVMLSLGTDIYTVSKLLGHANIGTTQIYAAVLDESKRKAVSRIPDIL